MGELTESELRGHAKDCACRQCKLLRFAVQVEHMLDEDVEVTPEHRANSASGDGGLTTEEYAQLFESKVRELYTQTVESR